MSTQRAATRTIAGVVIALAACAAAPIVTGADSADSASTTFSTPGEHDYTVPAGVTTITVTAIGATGQTVNGVHGGDGAVVTATVAVTRGEKLYLYVDVGSGGRGSPGAFEAGDPGGHGGGESDVRTCPDTAASCGSLGSANDPRLLVAGGGGGASGYAGSEGGAAGIGVAPCAPGKSGAADGPSGLGATCSAGGGRGPTSDVPYVGTDGEAGAGGTGGSGYVTEAAGVASNLHCGLAYNGGGGGGAGYFGGGGGDAGCADLAGGGGGGSSFVAASRESPPAGGTIVVSHAEITASEGKAASVRISHGELTTAPPSNSGGFPLWIFPIALAVLGGAGAVLVQRLRRPATA